MTAETTTFNHTHAASAGSMVSIFPMPGGAAEDNGQPDLGAQAVAGLKGFLASEGPGLERLLSLLDFKAGEADVATLQALLIKPGDVGQVLFEAERLLDRLVEQLAEAPFYAEVQRPIRPEEEFLVCDLDGWINWYGARTQEALNLVRGVLD